MKFLGKDPNIIDAYYTATAEGAITAGKPVIVEADGDVAVVATTVDPTPSAGTATVFESATTNWVSAAYDTNAEKVVVAYQDNGNSSKGTAVVGTVSGTSISFGTPVVFESGDTRNISIVYDANAQKVVIVYKDNGNSNKGTAIVGTVSGTSISFGSAALFQDGVVDEMSAVYDSSSQKVVVAYKDDDNNNYGTARVGTVSGTSISFGSDTVFESAFVTDISIAYDANAQKVVIAYADIGNSNYGTAIVGTVSGTSISFGSPTVFESANCNAGYIRAAYDANAQRIVIAYRDQGNSSYK